MASITACCSSVILPLTSLPHDYGKSSITGSGSATAGALVLAGMAGMVGIGEGMEGMNGAGRVAWAAGWGAGTGW